jgi:aminoglycoside 3-N-acetyltransferase
MKKKILFKKIINKSKNLIKLNDTIFLHTDFLNFFLNKNYFYSETEAFHFFFNIFKRLVGKNGNIIIPAFSYSWKKKKKNFFDVNLSSSKIGFFSEYIRKNNLLTRSLDPIFSFYVYGPKKFFFLDINESSFGKNCIYEKITKLNGKIIMWGIKRFDPTYVHYIEQYYNDHIKRYPFRFKKKMEGDIIIKNKKVKKKLEFFLRPKNSKFIYDEKKIKKILIKKKCLKTIFIGNIPIQAINCQSFFRVGLDSLVKNNKLFVKNV